MQVPGRAISPSNSRAGSPSAAAMSRSKARVCAFRSPVVVASVYSHAFAPVSLYKRYCGSIKKPVAFSSLPAHLSAYSWYTVLKGWYWMPVFLYSSLNGSTACTFSAASAPRESR